MNAQTRASWFTSRQANMVMAAVFCLFLPAAMVKAQLSTVNLNLYGNISNNKISGESSDWRSLESNQNYALQVLGYLISPQIVNFSAGSTFRDRKTTMFYTSGENKNSVRNLDFYKLNVRLLGSSRIPISIRAQRSAVANYVFNEKGSNWAKVSETPRETLGLSWRLPATILTPNLSLNYDRNLSAQGDNTSRTDNYNLTLYSTSADGKSNYNAGINELRSTSIDAAQNQSTTSRRQLSFQTSSTLHDRINVGTRLNNTTSENNSHSLGVLSFDLKPSRQLRHQLELHYEIGSAKSKYLSRDDATVGVTERTNFYWSGGNRIDFGMNVQSKQTVTSIESFKQRSGELFGNGQFNKHFTRYRLTTSTNARVGYSEDFGSARINGQTGLNLSLATQQFQRLQITVIGGGNYNYRNAGNSSYGTKAGLRCATSVIPRIYLTTDLSQQDTWSGNGVIIARNYNIQSKASTRLGRSLQMEVENIQRWYDMAGQKMLASSITRLRLVESGLIRDASLMVTAQRIHHQYKPADDILVSASVQYKFYAYFIKLRYNYQRGANRLVFLEFSRPVSIL